MRSFVVIGALVALVGCSAVDPSTPTKVSWQYGAGNGDGVAYPGPAPKYNRAYGLGADQVATPVGTPTVNYGYGAENQTGTMVQLAPNAPQQQMAAPTPMPNAAPASSGHPAPGTHS